MNSKKHENCHHLGRGEAEACEARTAYIESFWPLARDVSRATGGADIHTRMRAYYALSTKGLEPEQRETLAKACRAALVTGDWKTVHDLVWSRKS